MDTVLPATRPPRDFIRIDLHDLLQQNKPALAAWMPGFLVSALGKLLHIDELNTLLEEHWNDDPVEFLNASTRMLDMQLAMVHQERLKAILDSRPVIVGNHPLGGPESLLLADAVAQSHPGLKVVSQEIMMSIKPLAPMLVPVPKNEKKAQANELFKAFRNNDPLMLFPAGYCSRPLSFGDVYDFQWFKTFVKVARMYNRPVVPVYIKGTNSTRFYNWYNVRHALHVKTSIETVLLVDEMFRQRGNTITVTIGEPISPKLLSKAVSDQEWADRIRQYVYWLGKDASARFDPTRAATLPLV